MYKLQSSIHKLCRNEYWIFTVPQIDSCRFKTVKRKRLESEVLEVVRVMLVVPVVVLLMVTCIHLAVQRHQAMRQSKGKWFSSPFYWKFLALL